MKLFIRYSFLFILAFLYSCTDEIVQSEEVQDYDINITLLSSSLTTKGTMDGVDDLNENKISTVHYFLYPKDANNPNDVNPDVQPSYWGVMKNVNTTNIASVKLKVSEPVFNKVIFPRPYEQCDVYVVVNMPSHVEVTNASDKSLSYLKSISLSADFLKHPQDLFVMEGLGTIQVTSRNETYAASGTIMAKRVAAKMTVKVEAVEEVTINDVVWKSQPSEMKIDFNNGVCNALLSADPLDNTSPEYFNLDISDREAFYSYPIKWHIGEENEPFLKIMLPWTHEVTDNGTTRWESKPTYYKAILGGDVLERNTWSDLTIKLSAPGNFEEFPDYDILILNVDYKVMDWGVADSDWNKGLEVDTEILESRYLVVDSDYYEMNNQSTLKIPFTTSHDCEIVDKTITRPNYENQDKVTESTINWDDVKWKLEVVNDKAGAYVQFEHKMNNDIKSRDIDFAPYTIKFKIRHADEAGHIYFREVTIIQNPAMVIKTEFNPGGNKVGNHDKGYVYVYGFQNITSGDTEWRTVRSLLLGGNHNPNMYIISTTVPFENYILSDPRETKVTPPSELGLSNESIPNNATWGKGEEPNYYYKTIETKESYTVMAPKFRVASSYGKCNSYTSYADSRKRCAAYQERGYPAGRWRVPTLAEISFIATLSSYGVMPHLFTEKVYYWTSAGAIYYPEAGKEVTVSSERNTANVRCVYDEWYWEQTDTYKVPVDKFTWGGMER